MSEKYNELDAVACKLGEDALKMDYISNGVQGLKELSEDPPFVNARVANLSYRADPTDQEDTEVTTILKQNGLVNWSRTVRHLTVLKTTGKGNCLEVAISNALWGFVPPARLLRRLIYVSLVEYGPLKYQERWQKQCYSDCDNFSNNEKQWNECITSALTGHVEVRAFVTDARAASDSVLSDALQVFVLANILRRPIVVLSNHADCRGVYLPLLWDSTDCIKYPLVLAYHQSQFLPLVGSWSQPEMESAVDFIPLVSSQFEPLKVWFLLDNEEHEAANLEQRYMNLSEVNFTDSHNVNMILGARLQYQNLKLDSATVSSGISAVTGPRDQAVAEVNLRVSCTGASEERIENIPAREQVSSPCALPNCCFFTPVHTHPFCHKHVRHGTTSTATAIEPTPDMSVTESRCNETGCGNYASRFVYPYCYEHIERKIVDNVLQQQRSPDTPLEEAPLNSVMLESCVHPGCVNRSSIWTYPVCYEHIGYFSEKSTASCEETAQNTTNTAAAIRDVNSPSSQKYAQTMSELETKTKGVASKCKNPGCVNFGNSRSRGYCNSCFKFQSR